MRLIALLLPSLLAAACNPASTGDGNVTRSLRDVGTFHGVEASGAIVLDVTVGATPRVEVLTDSNLKAKVIAEVRDGILVIRANGPINPTGDVRVVVVTASLEKLALSGACKATMHGMAGGSLTIEASGASGIAASGQVQSLTVETSGASDIDTGDLIADRVSVDASGASAVVVHARETLDIEASGASKIEQRGPGRTRKLELSGASTFQTAGADGNHD